MSLQQFYPATPIDRLTCEIWLREAFASTRKNLDPISEPSRQAYTIGWCCADQFNRPHEFNKSILLMCLYANYSVNNTHHVVLDELRRMRDEHGELSISEVIDRLDHFLLGSNKEQ